MKKSKKSKSTLKNKIEENISSEQSEVASNRIVNLLQNQNSLRLQTEYLSVLNYMSSQLKHENINRVGYYYELSKLRDNFVTNGIYDIVMNDVFLDYGTENYAIIEVPKHPELSKELNDLFEDLNIFGLITDIFPDLLHYGCHSLVPILEDGVGLVSLLDIYDSYDIIAVTDLNNVPLFYFIQKNTFRDYSESNELKPRTFSRRTITQSPSYTYKTIKELVYFHIGNEHTRVSLDEDSIEQLKSKLPKDLKERFGYGFKIKVPKSFISGSIDKIRETVLMDKIRVFKSIGDLMSPTVIGVPVPEVYDIRKLSEMTGKYNEIINGRTQRLGSINDPKFTIQDVANVAVIPISGDKGNPQVLNTGKGDRTIPVTSVEDSLSQALNTIGIPLDLFLGNQDTSPKDNVRRNARYSKKIKRIQKHIANSIKVICLLHISSKYENTDLSIKDIDVILKNNNNADELHNLEPLDLLISSFNNVFAMLENAAKFAEDSNYSIDKNMIMESLKEKLESIDSSYSKSIVKTGSSSKVVKFEVIDKGEDNTY